MSTLFATLKTDGLEQSEDRLGGYAPKKTSIYTATIKALYAGASSGGAQNLTLIATLADGSEYRETVYITNKKGENFWIDTKNGNKRMPLPGFTLMDDLCLVTDGKPLAEQEATEKVINIYDKDAGKELPKPVQMLMDVVGKQVSLAIQLVKENKNEQNGAGEWVPTAEERVSNSIAKVFHTETKMTTAEARNGLTAGEFWDAWLERNEGKEVDKRTIKDGAAAPAGKGAPAKSAPAAGAAGGTARPSLFGNK